MDIHSTYHSALQHHQQGQLAQAEALYRKVLEASPQHADALHYLGVIYHQNKQHDLAVTTIAKALAIDPNNSDFLSNQAIALKAAGRLEDAIKTLQHALTLAPDDLEILYNLGNAYAEHLQFEGAATCYRRILQAYPQDEDLKQALCHALQASGNEYQQTWQYTKAESSYQEAIRIIGNEASLYFNLGNAQRELGKATEAAQQYQKAIQLSPSDADAYNNLGNVQRELGDLDASIASYRKALDINPKLYHAKVHLVHQKQHICDWQDLEKDINEIRAWLSNAPEAQISPFAFLSMPNTTAHEQKQCANNWLKNRYTSAFNQGKSLGFKHHTKPQTGPQKLRLGYLSADFRLHPLASLVSELIELHDRSAFEMYAYSYGVNDQSAERKRLEDTFDNFVDIRTLSTLDAATKINQDEIDILVDLTGFTQTSRSQIVALRPAPINVSWLGFPGTMGDLDGEPLFDYILSDAFITPLTEANAYSEKLALLPLTYQPNDTKRPIGKAKSRIEYGLPEHGFVFCCFNQTFKILPEVFDCWMRLLKQTPNSVLWLLECNQWAKRNLIREAETHGVNKERLIFAPRVPMAEHLARQTCADLFLDTLPYNAHTTASDALWMGLPVLTCAEDTFASRVAGSLLKASNLEDLVTYSLEDYESKALTLANNPDELKRIKAQLTKHNTELPLFNTSQFAKDLECQYQSMWKTHTEA
jgi:predicted O-linked N-acetylglucosamine transferase (SPINDLY family)